MINQAAKTTFWSGGRRKKQPISVITAVELNGCTRRLLHARQTFYMEVISTEGPFLKLSQWHGSPLVENMHSRYPGGRRGTVLQQLPHAAHACPSIFKSVHGEEEA